MRVTVDHLAPRGHTGIGRAVLDSSILWGMAYLHGEPYPAALVGDVITLVADAGELRRALLVDRASFDHYRVVRIEVVAVRLHQGTDIEIDVLVVG